SGYVAAWGSYRTVELGYEATEDLTAPQDVPRLLGVISIAAGPYAACAFDSHGLYGCVGQRISPVYWTHRPMTPDAVAVASGGHHLCERWRDGRVACVGYNTNGLGPGGV